MPLNTNRSVADTQTLEISRKFLSSLPDGESYFALLCGDPATNQPNAAGVVAETYQAHDLPLVDIVTYWRNEGDDKTFVNWMFTGLRPGEVTHDPLYDLGLHNPRLQSGQKFANKSPKRSLFIPLLGGVVNHGRGDYSLQNPSLVLLEVNSGTQISNFLSVLTAIEPKISTRKVNGEYVNTEEPTGIGRILRIRKGKENGKTVYNLTIVDAPALNLGLWANAGLEAIREEMDKISGYLSFWLTPEVQSLIDAGNDNAAATLAVSNVRANFMRRVGVELPDDVTSEQIAGIWSGIAERYSLAAEENSFEFDGTVQTISGNDSNGDEPF